MHHAVLRLDTIEFELQDLLIYSVAALVCKTCDGAASARREQDLVVVEQAVLPDRSKNVAASDVVADFVLAGGEVPLPLTVKGRYRDTAGYVDAVRFVGNGLEGALNAVIDSFHETRTEFDGEGLSGSVDGVADSDTSWIRALAKSRILSSSPHTSLLVHLDSSSVRLNSNDFSDEIIVANLDKLVHSTSDHVLGNNDGSTSSVRALIKDGGDVPGDGEDLAFEIISIVR